jgi:GNAT superfamily N-acetyltransferase
VPVSVREIRELRPGETGLAHAAMTELRTAFADDRDGFVHQVDTRQRPAGYRLLAAFEGGQSEAAAVAGFRRVRSLAWGDVLYVDDLATRASSRRGHGLALLEAIAAEGRTLGCGAIHLDSGHHRYGAHRLYLGAGYQIRSHHLVKDL